MISGPLCAAEIDSMRARLAQSHHEFILAAEDVRSSSQLPSNSGGIATARAQLSFALHRRRTMIVGSVMPFLRATGLGDYAAMAEVARMRLQDLALLPLGAWPTARAIRDKAGYEAAVRDHIGPILAAAQAEAEALLAGLTVARERARVAERQSDRAGELVMGGDAVVGHGSLTQRIVR